MKENLSHVGMNAAICMVCGKKHTTGILLDMYMRKSLPRETVTHYELCPECKTQAETHVCLIEAEDEGKETLKPEEAKRTGRLVWVSRNLSTKLFKAEIPVMAFVDKMLMDWLEEQAKS